MERQFKGRLCAGIALFLFCTVEYARAGCPCNADVNNSGGAVNAIDVAIVVDCAEGASCAQCINSCDVDCDGNVDFEDWGAVWCAFEGRANCCDVPTGACTGVVLGGNTFPSCVVADEEACEDPFAGGTYHGANSICVNGGAVVVPAVSTWGFFVLLLCVLAAGTLVLGRRRPAQA